RTGIPEQFESWSAYENFVSLLVKLNCIDTGKKIWWDVRPHPTFGTLEFRMCDVTTKIEEAVAIAALTQALIVKLHRLYTSNQSWRLYRRERVGTKTMGGAARCTPGAILRAARGRARSTR